MAEEVGGLSLPITADFSGLDADFQAAIATAVSEGATLAEAINRALQLPDTTPLQDALRVMGEASTTAAGQLGAMGDAATQAGAAAGGAAANVNTLGDAGHHAAEGGHEAHDSWAEFGSELAGMVGISLTIEGLIDLAKEALNAADAITKTTIALTTLTGSGEKAEEILVGLEELGMKDGLRMPGLRDAATQMEALLPAGTDVVEVLGHIADGAAVMGKGIEQGAQAFDRIVEGGMLSTRTLSNLGLRMDDIGAAMTELGASADVMAAGTKKAFSELDKEGRVAVVTEALQKLDGVAKKVADETFGGAWNRAANQFEKDMEGMGAAIMPMALQALPAVESAMKAVLATAVLVGTGLQVLVDGVVGLTTIALSSIKGLAQTWAEAMSGNFKGAITTATQAFDDVKAAAKFSWDSIINDSTKGAEVLAKIYATDIPRDTKTAASGADDLTLHFNTAGDSADKMATKLATATHAFVDIAKAAADGMLDFQTKTERAWEKVGLFAASQEHINELLAVSKARFDAGQMSADAYGKVLAEVDKINKELVKSLDEVNKIAKQIADAAWAKQMNDAAIAAMDLGNNLKALGLNATPIAPVMSELNRATSDFGISAGKAKLPVEDLKVDIGYLTSELGTLVAAAQKSGDWSGLITAIDNVDKRIQALAKTDLPEAARQLDVWIQGMINTHAPTELVQGQLDKLQTLIQKMSKEGLPEAAAAWKAYLALLDQVPQTIGAILKAQEDEANAEIRAAEARGTGAEEWILKLKAVQIQQELLKIQADELGHVYVSLIDDVLKGFDSMGKAIADNIVDGEKWGKVWTNLLESFAKSVLETVIQGALLPLKTELLGLISQLLPNVKLGLDASASAAKGLADAASQAAKSAENMSAAADKVTAAMGSGGGAGGAGASGLAGSLSHLTSIIDVIADVISAGAAVASTIILSHISSDTGHIEVNTRGQLAEAINLRADLWQQYNTMYDRLGECKNALDGILMAMQNITVTASALPAEALANLAQLPVILGVLGTINSNVLGVLADANLMVLGLQNINDNVFQVHNDLGVVIGRLDTVITSLIYGNHSADQASRATMDSFSSFSQSASQIGHGIIGAIDEGTGETARGTDVEISAAEAARTAAARAYASATSLQGQLAGLQAQIAADNQLAAALTRSGNASLAATYTAEANKLSQDVRALLPQLGTMVSSTQNVAQMVGQLDLNSGGYIANSTTQIVGAVYGAASVVAAAVGAAYAAGGYATGEGTTTKIPKGTGAFPPPVTQTGNPGNSGASGGTAPNGAGGYVIPLPPTSYAPSQSSTMHNPDGSVAEGNYVPQKNQNPFDPINPFTWTNNMTQAQWDAINNSHVPSFDQGGIQSKDMLSLVHKDEMVLPPDISMMLRSMATTPALPGRVPSYSGAPAAGQGGIGSTIINMPVTFNGVTDAKQLMDMWTQRVKLLIPRATVFSS